MQARLRFWLLGILTLVVVSLLGVFEPIKFRDRTDPDTGRAVRPVKRLGPIRFYKPYPGITLGLDLRGGTHLVLQAQKEGVFTFTMKDPASEDERTELRRRIVSVLGRDVIGTGKRTVEIEDRKIIVRTRVLGDSRAETEDDLDRQGEIIAQLLEKELPDLEVSKPELQAITRDNLESIERILERRVNASGITEPVIQRQPPDRIVIELAGVKDPEMAKRMVQQTAVLEFRAIPRRYAFGEERQPQYSEGGRDVIGFRVGSEEISVSKVLDESEVLVSGRDLKSNSSRVVSGGKGTAVTFAFKGAARTEFENFTRAHVKHYLAIVLDGNMISCPIINSTIPGEGIIEGGFDRAGGLTEARDLSILLNAGALPFDLEYVEERTVSAELGGDALRKSLYAGLMGLAVVLLFMVAYYRLPGLVADVALIVYCILLMGAIKLIGQVLTLPGVLAVIISIGMAVDANIIIFERLKEEVRTGKTMRSAVEAAFKRAWAAIFDSNVCSIGTGIVLYAFGTGPIKGFAVALIVGVAVSLFTAITVSRLLINIVVESRLGRNLWLFGVSPSEVQEGRS